MSLSDFDARFAPIPDARDAAPLKVWPVMGGFKLAWDERAPSVATFARRDTAQVAADAINAARFAGTLPLFPQQDA